jgi:hypothetical protein
MRPFWQSARGRARPAATAARLPAPARGAKDALSTLPPVRAKPTAAPRRAVALLHRGGQAGGAGALGHVVGVGEQDAHGLGHFRVGDGDTSSASRSTISSASSSAMRQAMPSASSVRDRRSTTGRRGRNRGRWWHGPTPRPPALRAPVWARAAARAEARALAERHIDHAGSSPRAKLSKNSTQ